MKDDQLTQQFFLVKQQLYQNSAALDLLVKEIVKSRTICRPATLALQIAVFLEIFAALELEVYRGIDQQIKDYDGDRPPIRAWALELMTGSCRLILTDQRLQGIALFAQSTPPLSQLQQIAFTELVESIRVSGKLAKPHRGKFAPQFYELLYEEAVNQTLIYICQKIHLYDPNRSNRFMTWVNFRLDKMLIEARRDFSAYDQQDLPELNDLDRIPQPEAEESLAQTVQDFVRADSEGVFQAAHIRNRPDVSFQAIALARFQGQSWEDLSTQYQIKIPTLSSFFQRSCQKFGPMIQSHCC